MSGRYPGIAPLPQSYAAPGGLQRTASEGQHAGFGREYNSLASSSAPRLSSLVASADAFSPSMEPAVSSSWGGGSSSRADQQGGWSIGGGDDGAAGAGGDHDRIWLNQHK